MKIKLLAFGIAREIIGKKVQDYDFSGGSVADLRKEIENKFPAIAHIKTFAIAVNLSYCADDVIINEHDEVAIIPPVSGG